MSRVDKPARVEREDLVVEALETPLAASSRSAARSCPADRAASRSAPARARSQASSPSSRCGCCRSRRAAPGAARSRDARSARPPSPAPPAAWSTARAARPARRSPPPSGRPRAARRSPRRQGDHGSRPEARAARRRAARPLRSPSGLAPRPADAPNQITAGLRRHDAPSISSCLHSRIGHSLPI